MKIPTGFSIETSVNILSTQSGIINSLYTVKEDFYQYAV